MNRSQRKVYDIFAAAGFGWVRGQTLLMEGGGRFGSRLHELKAYGWEHETRRDPTSSMPQYRLFRAEPDQIAMAL